jgi:hypothetical protein
MEWPEAAGSSAIFYYFSPNLIVSHQELNTGVEIRLSKKIKKTGHQLSPFKVIDPECEGMLVLA